MPASRTAVMWVLLACVVPRVLLWLVYGPVEFLDTGTYLALARQLNDMDFSGYIGTRTPVYPLLLVLARFDPLVVWLIQSALGVGIAVVLFAATIRSGWPPLAAALAAAIPAISLDQLLWEANLLNETTAAFLIVVSLLQLVGLGGRAAGFADGLGLGGVSGLVALTRPMYVYLGPLYVLLIGLALGRRGWRAMSGVVLAFGLLVGGWAGFNYLTVGQFGLTTLMGYNLSQHSGGFIERAPDRYAAIRDTYLTYRQERLQAGQTHSMVIWSARGDIKSRTGLSDVQLSAELTRMSVELFVRNPGLYLASVARAWSRFWAIQGYWKPEQVAGKAVRDALVFAWQAQRWLLLGANVALLLLALGGTLRWAGPLRAREQWLHLPVAALVVVLVGSVVQALLEFGENARYAVPTHPLVVATVVLAAYAGTVAAWHRRSRRARPAPTDQEGITPRRSPSRG